MESEWIGRPSEKTRTGQRGLNWRAVLLPRILMDSKEKYEKEI
jgi:hypothetical protein